MAQLMCMPAKHAVKRRNALIDRFANGAAGAPFLVQRYVTPYRTKTIPPATDLEWLVEQGLATNAAEVEREGVLYNNISGLYLYNGTFTRGILAPRTAS